MRAGHAIRWALACIPILASLALGCRHAASVWAAARTNFRESPSLHLAVQVGWNNRFRAGGAWTPVRVTVHNTGSTSIRGTVEITDDRSSDPQDVPRPWQSVYATSLFVPARNVRTARVVLPGADITGTMDATFRTGQRVIAHSSVFPVAFDEHTVTVGVLTSDPASAGWLNDIHRSGMSFDVVPLTPETLDAAPEVLAAFDLIVVTNLNASRLDQAQTWSLQQYVRDGGSLLLIGGPDWRESLYPLPGTLLPGSIGSFRTLAPGTVLCSLETCAPVRRRSTATPLLPRWGAVVLSPGRFPLIVQAPLGLGRIEYAGFDPAVLAPGSSLVSHLVTGSAAEAMRRLSLPDGYPALTYLNPGISPIDVASVAANRRASPTNWNAHLALAGVAYYLILVLLWVRARSRGRARLRLSHMAVSLVATVALVHSMPGMRQAATLVNLLGTIDMSNAGPVHPATVYLSMLAPARGSYHVDVASGTLAASVGQYPRPYVPGVVRRPLGWRFMEGAGSAIDFLDMPAQSTRTAVLRTRLTIPGQIEAHLHIGTTGMLTGTVRNTTAAWLRRPALIAGQSATLLPDLAPGSTIDVHVTPRGVAGPQHVDTIMARLYGQSGVSTFHPDSSRNAPLTQRIRDALGAMPEVNTLPLGEPVMLVGWANASLAHPVVNGHTSGESDLFLLTRTLTMAPPARAFRLRAGTIGARLIDLTPSRPSWVCCTPVLGSAYVSTGGSATYCFSTPMTHERVRQMSISMYAGGADPYSVVYSDVPRGAGRVWNWRRARWEALRFRNRQAMVPDPARYVSSIGAILVRLSAGRRDMDMVIADAHQDLQVEALAQPSVKRPQGAARRAGGPTVRTAYLHALWP
ncbi:MAG: hypothetical protein NVSMB22_10330 [Chloroflexota bacterium]